MIVTREAQQRVVDKYDTKDKTTKQLIAFTQGLEAAFELIDKITKDNLNR